MSPEHQEDAGVDDSPSKREALLELDELDDGGLLAVDGAVDGAVEELP